MFSWVNQHACQTPHSPDHISSLAPELWMHAWKLLRSATRGWTFLTHPFRQAVLHTDVSMSSGFYECFKSWLSRCLYHHLYVSYTLCWVFYSMICNIIGSDAICLDHTGWIGLPVHHCSFSSLFQPFSHIVERRIFCSRPFSFELLIDCTSPARSGLWWNLSGSDQWLTVSAAERGRGPCTVILSIISVLQYDASVITRRR